MNTTSTAILRRLVTSERQRRGWSIRTAAAKSDMISNTSWSRFEAGEVELTPKMQQAIAKAFGWPSDWADSDVAKKLLSQPTGSALLERLELLASQVDDLTTIVEQLKGQVDHLRDEREGGPQSSSSGGG